jgi:hypothetical protein
MQASCCHTECSGGRVCYPCATSSCCCDSQNALVEKGVLSLRCMHAAVDPQNVSGGRCAILRHASSPAVDPPQMLCKKGVPLRCHANWRPGW